MKVQGTNMKDTSYAFFFLSLFPRVKQQILGKKKVAHHIS